MERAAGELAGKYPNVAVRGLTFDVTDKAQIESAMQIIRDAGNGLQILVNNAGIRRDGVMFMMSDDDWHDVLRTTLDGFFFLTRRILKHVMPRHHEGRIINLASPASRVCPDRPTTVPRRPDSSEPPKRSHWRQRPATSPSTPWHRALLRPT